MEITTSGKQIPSLGLKEQREQRKLYKRREGALGCWNPGLWGGDIRQLVADVWGGNGREDEALCMLKKLRIGFSGCYKKSSLATGVKRSGLLWFSVASLPVRKPPEGKQGGVNRSSPESWCSSRASCWEEPGGAKMWFVVWVPRSPGLPCCKESACSAGDAGSIPGLGISPGGGHGNPLQYSSLENLMDRGAWRATAHGVTRNWRQLTPTVTKGQNQRVGWSWETFSGPKIYNRTNRRCIWYICVIGDESKGKL